MAHTTLRELGVIQEDLYAIPLKLKKKGIEGKKLEWYPYCPKFSSYDPKKNNNTIFIMGQGHVKLPPMDKWVKLEPKLSAEYLSEVYKQYGVNVACGCIKGWSGNLYSDNSYGLHHIKFEVLTWAKYGKSYDIYLDTIHSLNDELISMMKSRGWEIDNCLSYKGEFLGFLDKLDIRPIHYIEHSVGEYHFSSNWSFMGFDVMKYEALLDILYSRVGNDKSMPINSDGSNYSWEDKSVKEKMAYFSNEEVANKFQDIFTWESEMLRNDARSNDSISIKQLEKPEKQLELLSKGLDWRKNEKKEDNNG